MNTTITPARPLWKKKRFWFALVAVLWLIGVAGTPTPAPMTSEERDAYNLAQSTARLAAMQEARKERDNSSRIHGCERQLKANLRDPDSYEQIRAWVSADNKVNIQYRAKNGFGGYTIDTAQCYPR